MKFIKQNLDGTNILFRSTRRAVGSRVRNAELIIIDGLEVFLRQQLVDSVFGGIVELSELLLWEGSRRIASERACQSGPVEKCCYLRRPWSHMDAYSRCVICRLLDSSPAERDESAAAVSLPGRRRPARRRSSARRTAVITCRTIIADAAPLCRIATREAPYFDMFRRNLFIIK